MYERYIVTAEAMYGYWGGGDTIEAATKNMKKQARGRGKLKNMKVWKFTSKLPFAPWDREAKENEADAYMNNDGMWWKRCEKEEVQLADFSKP